MIRACLLLPIFALSLTFASCRTLNSDAETKDSGASSNVQAATASSAFLGTYTRDQVLATLRAADKDLDNRNHNRDDFRGCVDSPGIISYPDLKAHFYCLFPGRARTCYIAGLRGLHPGGNKQPMKPEDAAEACATSSPLEPNGQPPLAWLKTDPDRKGIFIAILTESDKVSSAEQNKLLNEFYGIDPNDKSACRSRPRRIADMPVRTCDGMALSKQAITFGTFAGTDGTVYSVNGFLDPTGTGFVTLSSASSTSNFSPTVLICRLGNCNSDSLNARGLFTILMTTATTFHQETFRNDPVEFTRTGDLPADVLAFAPGKFSEAGKPDCPVLLANIKDSQNTMYTSKATCDTLNPGSMNSAKFCPGATPADIAGCKKVSSTFTWLVAPDEMHEQFGPASQPSVFTRMP